MRVGVINYTGTIVRWGLCIFGDIGTGMYYYHDEMDSMFGPSRIDREVIITVDESTPELKRVRV